MKIRYLSLFSGIEAASVAWLPLGWECVAVAEIEKFPCAVLKHHYPDVPNLGDITKITKNQIKALGRIDVVVGGFPCQDLSIAGKRKGLKHADGTKTRSGLFYIANQIAEWSGARFTLVENVPGIFSSNDRRDFASVVGELAGDKFDIPPEGWTNSGFALGKKGLVEWCVLDAQFFNVPQRRERVFIIRDSGDWQSRPPLLLERESLCGNNPPSREKREEVAGTISACSFSGGSGGKPEGAASGHFQVAPTISAREKGGGGLGTDFDCDGGLIAEPIPIQEIGKRQSGTSMNGVGHEKPGDPMYTLQSSTQHGIAQPIGIDGSEIGFALRATASHSGDKGDGGVNTTMVAEAICFNHQAEGSQAMISARTTHTDALTKNQTVAVAIPINMQCATKCGPNTPNGNGVGNDGDPASTLGANDRHAIAHSVSAPITGSPYADGESRETKLIVEDAGPIILAHGQGNAERVSDGEPSLTCNHEAPILFLQMAVRRLTPKECARLQGFSDSYLDIIYNGKPAKDGPKYKALGNSMAVPVMNWLGRQIEKALKYEQRIVG